ncbi:MAG: phosphoadenosine phosphosulfate reductase family protein [Clostridia bacterium]|nr:phosphoadenosine phosphosulfate reductase family protein [Clostridia bacterium]
MSIQTNIFDGTPESMLNRSLQLLKDFEDLALIRNTKGYAVGYSGGKDSDVLVRLFQMSGVKFFVFHNHTTLDAPETVYYVRKKFAEFEEKGIECMKCMPKHNFWELCIYHKMLPLRKCRFCCQELKEHDDFGVAVKSFGVRKAESVKRSVHRDSIEVHSKSNYSDIQLFHFDNTEDAKDYISENGTCKIAKQKTCVNPLAYWSSEALEDFIESEHMELNPLYAEGFKRVGCIGCPMAGENRIKEFERYPKFKDRFLKLCGDIVEIQKKTAVAPKT